MCDIKFSFTSIKRHGQR